MSSREFAEWQAYDQIEPIGGHRADVLTALLASVVANAAGGRKNRKPFTPAEFMPKWQWDRDDDADDGEQLGQVQQQRLMAFAQALVRATGGRDLRQQQQQRGNRGNTRTTERHAGAPGPGV